MNFSFKRKDKIGSFIQEEASLILQREVTDPRIGFVTVTQVQVTDDLRLARVFVSAFGSPEAQAASLEGLKSAKGFIRREIGRRLNIRFVPEIEFIKDDSLEKSIKVMSLLNQIKEEKDQSQDKQKRKPKKERSKTKRSAIKEKA